MGMLLALPIVAPLLSAALLIAVRPGHRARQGVTVATTAALLVVAILLCAQVWEGGIAVVQVGGVPAPFGITLVADMLTCLMLLIAAVVALSVTLYGLQPGSGDRHPLYHPMLLVMLAGADGAFVTGDLFNLYVWFEVMLISSFVLLVLERRPAQVRGAVIYVALNLVSSLLFLMAVGLLYGATGTLNIADLASRLPGAVSTGLHTTIAMLFLCAFGIKAALFPLFFWLPESYSPQPVVVSAAFAGLLTKVGVYALIRVFTMIFVHDVAVTHTVLLVISVLTMVSGVLGAAVQTDVRRILSVHIVSQIGYMTMALALFTPFAIAAAIFYVVHNVIVKTNLFLVAGVVGRVSGSFDLGSIGGLYRARPLLALLFLVPALSLAGVPPLSGFWAKLLVVKAGLDVRSVVAVTAALLVGLLTLYSMTKIWVRGFWEPARDGAPVGRAGFALVPIGALSALTLLIGVWARPLLAAASRAGAELMGRTAYIHAVLGGGP